MSQPAKQINTRKYNKARIMAAFRSPPSEQPYSPTAAQRIYTPIKRLLDIVFSLIALIILSPVFLIVAIIIKLESPGPVLFKQKRAGKNGVPFVMYKFRSMRNGAENELDLTEIKSGKCIFIKKIGDDPRITKFGRFIRKSSMDELPQFVNVLLGDMSMVGPRPLPLYEHMSLSPHQRMRSAIKPGLTCYWQVSGRSLLNEEVRVEMDLRYIRKYGPLTDLALILRTIPAVLVGIGAQ